jgi:hypothetical protein
MNIGLYFTGLIFLSAYLASVVIAFAYKAGLFIPIWTAFLWSFSINIVYIIGTAFIDAFGGIFTFSRAVLPSAQAYLMLVKNVKFSTKSARKSNPYISPRRRPGLMRSIFRSTLSRTYSGVSIGPIFKLLTAPFTSKDRVFSWIGFLSSVRTSLRTKSIRALSRFPKECFSAHFTNISCVHLFTLKAQAPTIARVSKSHRWPGLACENKKRDLRYCDFDNIIITQCNQVMP